MKLLTKELLKRFAQVGRQEDESDPLVIAKFFNPTGAGTWYATEYDPQDQIFFGYVSIFGDWNDEWDLFLFRSLKVTEASLDLVSSAISTLGRRELVKLRQVLINNY